MTHFYEHHRFQGSFSKLKSVGLKANFMPVTNISHIIGFQNFIPVAFHLSSFALPHHSPVENPNFSFQICNSKTSVTVTQMTLTFMESIGIEWNYLWQLLLSLASNVPNFTRLAQHYLCEVQNLLSGPRNTTLESLLKIRRSVQVKKEHLSTYIWIWIW